MKIDSCKACGEDYEKYHSQHFGGHISNECPKCGYHPKFESDINFIIRTSAKFEVQLPGRFSINAEELTDKITKKLLKYWPKPKK